MCIKSDGLNLNEKVTEQKGKFFTIFQIIRKDLNPNQITV